MWKEALVCLALLFVVVFIALVALNIYSGFNINDVKRADFTADTDNDEGLPVALFVPGFTKDQLTIDLTAQAANRMKPIFKRFGYKLIVSNCYLGGLSNESLYICTDRLGDEINKYHPKMVIGLSMGGLFVRHLVECDGIKIPIVVLLESTNGGFMPQADLVPIIEFPLMWKSTQDLFPWSQYMKDLKINQNKQYNYIEFHGFTTELFKKLWFLGVANTFVSMPGSEDHFMDGVQHVEFATIEANVVKELEIVTNSSLSHFFKQIISYCLFKKVKFPFSKYCGEKFQNFILKIKFQVGC